MQQPSQSSNGITYQAGTIQITLKRVEDEQPFQQECPAMIAYKDGRSTGLAYIALPNGNGPDVYSITHIASGLSVVAYWDATTESEAQAWIQALLRLADWTERTPVVTASAHQMLKYAVVGAVYAEIQKGEEAANGQ